MIFILTGSIHSGKTTLLKKIAMELKGQKYRLEGFLSEALRKKEEIVGYDLFDLKKERSIPLIRRAGKKEWQKIGSYFFIPQSLAEAEKIILQGKGADILIVDEVGPLELSGKGFWPALKQVVFQPLTILLFAMRISILEDFLAILGKSEVKIFNIKDEEIFHHLIKELKLKKKT